VGVADMALVMVVPVMFLASEMIGHILVQALSYADH
jgi:hypothetical protein